MFVSNEFLTLTKWLGLATIVFALFALLAFLFQWRFRFQLVGVTGFFAVLVVGSFGLSLGLFQRVEVAGAMPYHLVYDTGSNQAVITVEETIEESALAATLEQAAYNLFSPGRFGRQNQAQEMVIRARVLIHPQSGISQPVYVGEVHRSLSDRSSQEMQIIVFNDRLEAIQSGIAPSFSS